MSLNTGETVMKHDSMLPPVVLEIGKINFKGNIIPHEWYNQIKTSSGRTDLVAIVILAEIVYWYRPIEELDEKTGKLLPLRQKFSGDMFQSSLSYYQTKFGLTKKQVRSALDNLESQGLIKREKRSITTDTGMKLSNVLFIEPIPKAVLKFTYSECVQNRENYQQNQSSALEGTRCALEGTSYVPQGQTYTEITTKTSTKNTHTQTPTNVPIGETDNVCVYLSDFEKVAWDWAQSHDFWKRRITTIEQLRANLAQGKAFRTQFEPASKPIKGNLPKQTKDNTKKAAAIEACLYCDKTGTLFFRMPDGRIGPVPCDHKADRIVNYALDKNATIESAQPGYQRSS